ncbi:hypothetical protein PHMEG_00034494 [Phytophthora megakarya]|uniref:Uncharacterized protein n=1 Tax=Phytophthora megakarya TaxID=4795 RepID=A0A225UQX6_9STRA|nr:hypothetical protein PHMEG_00034494 [Phytophthora megakarya]
MCWEALPYENAWIEVEYGILLKHETGEPGDKEDKKTKMFVETKVNFKFFSTLVEKGKELRKSFFQNIEDDIVGIRIMFWYSESS